MNYEEKYKEALEVMRQWIAPCHTKEQLDTLKKSVFPELAESEDEKIRKELLFHIQSEIDTYDNMISGDYDSRDKEDKKVHSMLKRAIAWIEKQKEQKIMEQWPNISGCKHDCKHCFAKCLYRKEENDEQKQEWSEEDKLTIADLINYFEGDSLECSTKEMVQRIKSLRPKSHWKPSEEQMKALLNAEGFLRAGLQYDSAKTIAELYEQLKKL